MSAIELLIKLGETLEVFTDVNGNVCVEYHDGYVKDARTGTLLGDPGRGKTFDEACRDYIQKIQGETIVFRSGTTARREVKVLFAGEVCEWE